VITAACEIHRAQLAFVKPFSSHVSRSGECVWGLRARGCFRERVFALGFSREASERLKLLCSEYGIRGRWILACGVSCDTLNLRS
jgi:hypothetical protein